MPGAPAEAANCEDDEDVGALSGTVDDDVEELLFRVRGSQENATILQTDKFALACSKKLMRSWVSQPSPCCAAAGVGKRRSRGSLGF